MPSRLSKYFLINIVLFILWSLTLGFLIFEESKSHNTYIVIIGVLGIIIILAALLYFRKIITKQYNAERLARENEERHKIMANVTFEGILVHNNGIVIDMNNSLEQMIGFNTKELFGKNFIHHFVAKPDQRIVTNKIKNSYTSPYEIELIRKDGSQFHAEFEGKNIIIDGKTTRINAIRDITSRKRDSIKLFNAQQNLRFHIEQTPLGVIEWNKNFEVVRWNKAAESIFDYSFKEAKGRYADFILANEVKPQILKIWNELLVSLDGNQTTNENITKNGERITCDWYNTPLINEHGQTVGVASMVQDVTEREKSKKLLHKRNNEYEALNEELRERNEELQAAEEELRASNDELRDLLDNLYEHEQKLHEAELIANIGHWELDLSTNDVKVSDGARKIFGISTSSIITMEQTQQLPIPEHREILSSAFYNLTQRDQEFNIEFKIKRKNDGMIRFIHSKAQYLKNKNIIFGVIKDITNAKIQEQVLKLKLEELHAAEKKLITSNEKLSLTNNKLIEYAEKLEEARKKAEESDRLKSTFLANMSHEIRTPMNAIIGFTQLLVSKKISEEKKQEFTEIVISSGEQLLSLVNDILDISRLETGQLKTTVKNFNVNDLLKSLASVFTHKAVAKGLKLVFENNNEELVISTDESRVRQILSNLITNAVKYTEKGDIHFGYSYNNQNIRFYVKDTGIGIDKEFIKKIFNRFEQEERGIKIGSGGVGLGLSICKGLVTLLGGEIGVKSEIDEGSEFFFNIPFQKVTKPESNKTVDLKQPIDFSELTILIAEDNELNYKVIEALLESTNAKLIHAENGQEAIDLYQSNPKVKLILMDIRMPVMDGYKACEEIKKLNSDIPIIAQTAYALDNEKQQIMEADFDDYLAKPIKKEELLKTIYKIAVKQLS